MNNQEQINTQGKTLIVNLTNHKTLSLMKIEGEFKSVDDVISKLIESHNKLMELKQKEKRKK